MNYLLKALYRAMHVPTNYLDPQAQTNSDPSALLREELDYADFIINIQKHFVEPIKQGWITSLKMKGKWEQYKLRENMIDIEFNPPHAYYEMRKLQVWQQRFAAFSEATSNDLMSKTLMMKRLLKWTNEEIRDNLKLRKLEAAHEWEVSQISSTVRFGSNRLCRKLWRTRWRMSARPQEVEAVISVEVISAAVILETMAARPIWVSRMMICPTWVIPLVTLWILWVVSVKMSRKKLFS